MASLVTDSAIDKGMELTRSGCLKISSIAVKWSENLILYKIKGANAPHVLVFRLVFVDLNIDR